MDNSLKNEAAKTAKLADSAAKVVLGVPLQTPNGTVAEISFRRGKARDLVAAQRIEPTDNARRELVLMAMLTEQKLTIEDMEELDLADMLAVQEAFQAVLARPQ